MNYYGELSDEEQAKRQRERYSRAHTAMEAVRTHPSWDTLELAREAITAGSLGCEIDTIACWHEELDVLADKLPPQEQIESHADDDDYGDIID